MNDSNIFVNLSHVLLSKITKYLRDNIDKIFFSLVCKRWFEERHKYLKFNRDRFFINSESSILLNSYRSLIQDSFKKEIPNGLHIGNNVDVTYDISTTIDGLKSIDPTNIRKVVAAYYCRLPSETEEIYSFIERSNVTKLVCCQTMKYRIPMNLTSIIFPYWFNEPLVKDHLPPTLKSLSLGEQFNHPIEPGVLPDTLEKLKINSKYSHIMLQGALPSSLKYFYSWNHISRICELPPSLEVLILNLDRPSLIDGELPLTLRKLEYAPNTSQLSIKSLVNIESLTLDDANINNNSIFDLSQLPPNLNQLTLITLSRLTSAMPTSLRHLDLGYHSNYDIDEIFPNRSNYQFESLAWCGNRNKRESLEGLKIKSLTVLFEDGYGEDLDLPSILTIPNGIESLEICETHMKILNEQSIPSSVKVLEIHNFDCFECDPFIPKTVEHLKVPYLESYDVLNNFYPSSPNQIITIPQLSSSNISSRFETTHFELFVKFLEIPSFDCFAYDPFIPKTIEHLKVPFLDYYETTKS
ncbi:hypothetical protein PPL_08588 [Heterostelium album PN500]|uniref:COI1 F-box domain-containing protein n=1 Tax=Heterostelium pallidum (strain ATCC 26659 / Pp 5 / PN500) TaxID=670386 RepID=D3BJ63_HETP5|nr:hypothetical protein PPL_08588 [Heterostelium album PN500]EFA77943.1 hypothetical protein PPL_08588 [Heterostelium album PN500]|eukprot:XP_020430071.1 hypothetical protein PPL_08588 [Heterostelium album PN500]